MTTSLHFPDGRVPLLISADTDDLLDAEAAALAAYLSNNPTVDVADVAGELMRIRRIRRHQQLVLAPDTASAADALYACASGEQHPLLVRRAASSGTRRVGLVFPGQGSQRPGMGRGFYDASTDYRAAVDDCDAVFQDLFEISPLEYLLHDEAPENIDIVQPALFLQTIGLAAMWRGVGVSIAATIGHSQGEIPAAATAGIISMRDAVRVVTTRARLVARVERGGLLGGPHAMAVIGLDRDGTEAAVARSSGWAELAVVNSPNIHAISGDIDAVTEIVERLTAQGVFAKQIRVDYPAHTSLLREFREDLLHGLLDGLDKDTFAESEIACYGGTLGTRVTPDLQPNHYWYWNLRNRVRFDQAVRAAAADGVTTFIEVSDHPTMMLALQDILRGTDGVRFIGTGRRGEPEMREFTDNVAAAIVGDSEFDWRARVPERTAPPLFGLPPTQMQRRHLWAERPDRARADRTAASDPAPNPTTADGANDRSAAAGRSRARGPQYAPHLLVEGWEELVAREISGPRRIAVLAPAGLNGDRQNALQDASIRMGSELVAPADADTVIVVTPESEDGTAAAIAGTARFLTDESWIGALPAASDVWLLTEGGELVGDDHLTDVAHAAIASGFRCFAADHPGIRFRHVDIQAGLTADEWATRSIDAVHTAGESEVAVRAGRFHAKRLRAATGARPAADLSEVLIIGGTGALGLDVAEELANRGAIRITLVSRSGGGPEVRRRIADLAEHVGSVIDVWTGDVTDPTAVDRLSERYADRRPSLIIHASVDYAAAERAATDVDAFIEAAVIKVAALDRVMAGLCAPSTRLLLCSSLSATIGGRGHRGYAALNRMLDATAINLRARGIEAVSVQWGLWRSVGASNDAAVQQIKATGLLPMDVAEALDAALATLPGELQNRLVVAADWPRLQMLLGLIGTGSLLRSEDLAASRQTVAATITPPDQDPAELTDGVAPEAAATDIPTHMRTVLAEVMGLELDDHVDTGVPLVSLGLDSVQALDLRQRLETDLRTEIPVTAMLSGATLDDLVELVDA